MEIENQSVSKEDYEEPKCLLNMNQDFSPIPLRRVLEKYDSYVENDEFDAAKRHLIYWIAEAEAGNDTSGKLAIMNELIGLFRMSGNETEGLQAIEEALSFLAANDFEDTVIMGTTYINAATGYKAFGKANEAIVLYRQAKAIYETKLESHDGRLGGLYNNMALTLSELEEYSEAKELYHKAIEVMKKQQNGALEQAITYLNIADLIAAQTGIEEGAKEIEDNLMQAMELLNSEALPRNGYYAYVCDKCAPVFGYYGYFMIERELKRRVADIKSSR